jgi:hypothetical protein
MVFDKHAIKFSLESNCSHAGLLQLAISAHAELTKKGLPPNTSAFNRLVEQCMDDKQELEIADYALEEQQDTRLHRVMSLLGCMEEEPLCLKPNERTFELAMLAVFLKPRMMTMSEALFQLMQTNKYLATPTKTCWICRIAAVMTSGYDSAAHRYYSEFRKLFSLDRVSATFLVKAAVLRKAFPLLYEMVLPDIESDASLSIDEAQLVSILGNSNFQYPEGIDFIRWVIRTDALDSKSPKYFNESLCWKWLDYIGTSALGPGASDIALASMNRIIEQRSVLNERIPRRILELYLHIVEAEESGMPGVLRLQYPDLCVPMSQEAFDLASQIRSELAPIGNFVLN